MRSKLNIWVVKVGEDLPLPGQSSRLMRTGQLVSELASRGHSLTWWTSTFRHHNKSFYFQKDTLVKASPELCIRLLHSPGYKKHISLKRLIDHSILGSKMKRSFLENASDKPDVIYCCVPTLETALAAVDFARHHRVPVVVDARDLWPDQYLEAFPRIMRRGAKLALRPYFKMAEKIFSQADSVLGITPAFLDWALSKAGRPKNRWDRYFPLTFELPDISEKEKQEALQWYEALGIPRHHKVGVFFGSFSRCFDFKPVIEAAERLSDEAYTFILCGDGDKRAEIKRMASHCTNIVFPGWLNRGQLQMVGENANFALAPYRDLPAFRKSTPNKVIEYMARKLWFFSSLEGVSKELFMKANLASLYQPTQRGALSQAIKNYMSLPDEVLSKNKERIHQYYLENFDPQRVYKDFADHIEAMAGLSRDKSKDAISENKPDNFFQSIDEHKELSIGR